MWFYLPWPSWRESGRAVRFKDRHLNINNILKECSSMVFYVKQQQLNFNKQNCWKKKIARKQKPNLVSQSFSCKGSGCSFTIMTMTMVCLAAAHNSYYGRFCLLGAVLILLCFHLFILFSASFLHWSQCKKAAEHGINKWKKAKSELLRINKNAL